MAGRTIRGLAASGVIATSALLALPASAHSSSYCGHDQSWVPQTQYETWGSVFRSAVTYDFHYHTYRHYRFFPYTGTYQVMHGDVTKQC